MRIIIFSNILKKLLDFAGDPVWGCDPDVEKHCCKLQFCTKMKATFQTVGPELTAECMSK